MKGNFPKLVLAVVIAVAVFAALRARQRAPDAETSSGEPSGQPQAQGRPTSRTPDPGPTLGAAQPAKRTDEAFKREPASLKSPAELFTELFRRGDWGISRGMDGRPTGLKGSPIQGATVDPKSALAFARKLAGQLGANPEQLSDLHSQSETDKGLQTMYKYDQWVGDNPVFGASMSVFSRRADAAAYLVNSSLKPIDDVPPQGIDRVQAEALVLAYYKDRGGKITTPAYNDEYIYADQAPTELAWYFVVNVSSPGQMKLKVLFGATTRRVLYEAPALVN